MRETGAGKRGLLASPQAGRGQTRRACTQPWWIRSRRASRSFGSALCCDSDGEHIAWKRLALVPALRKCSRKSGGATWGQGCQRRTLAVSQDTDRCNTGTASSRCPLRPRRGRPREGGTGPTVLLPLCVRRAGGGHGVSTTPTFSLEVERSSEQPRFGLGIDWCHRPSAQVSPLPSLSRHHPPRRTDKILCRCFGAPATLRRAAGFSLIT